MNSLKFIPASGRCEHGLMVIGEAPGAEEDAQGKPFVGRSGKLLDKLLYHMGFEREDVYVTNIVKVRPDNNRAPLPEERASWRPLLIKEILEVKPKVIMTVGATASQCLLEDMTPITQMRGNLFWRGDLKAFVIPTYHPSYLLRKAGDKKTNDEMKLDLNLVKKTLNKG